MGVLVFISGIISSASDVFSPVTYIFPVILDIFQPVSPAIISPCIPSIFAPVHDIQAIVN